MLSQSDKIRIEGYLLHRTIITPPIGTPIKAAAIFTHGQGDFSERYTEVLRPFTDRGIMCIGTDLLGHGRSPGTRGHGGDLELIDSIFQASLEYIGDLPYGLIGHSMGGLLSLRYYLVTYRKQHRIPDFAWISSPLLDPAHGRPDWFVKLALLSARLCPKLTLNTGVTPEMCRTIASADSAPSELRGQLGHRKISLGWAKELIHAARMVNSSFPSSHGPILYTQGKSDPVCPSNLAKDFCHSHPQIIFEQFDGMLHEPFADVGSELLFRKVAAWIDSEVIKTIT